MTSVQIVSCACIVKFGGAALTDKRYMECLNDQGFASCVKLASQLPSHSCIVHGAGSFGHFHAAQYNVKAGAAPAASAVSGSAIDEMQHTVGKGMCETRRSVLKLNALFFSALMDLGRSATPVHPMDCWETEDTVLSAVQLTSTQRCIEQNILPVLHGDVVFDSVRGYTVLSGDDILLELASRLRPPFVLFVSDVPGVFLVPPASASSAIVSDPTFISDCFVDIQGNITRLQLSVADSHHNVPSSLEVGGSAGTDITGGGNQFYFCSCLIVSSDEIL